MKLIFCWYSAYFCFFIGNPNTVPNYYLTMFIKALILWWFFCSYFYRLSSGKEPLSTFEKDRAWHVPEELDLLAMQVVWRTSMNLFKVLFLYCINIEICILRRKHAKCLLDVMILVLLGLLHVRLVVSSRYLFLSSKCMASNFCSKTWFLF